MTEVLGVYDTNGKLRQVDDNNGYPMVLTGSNASDGQSSLISGMGYNGATFDRWRNNMQGTLLASAARTATTSSPQQINYNARGIMLFLNISAASGTGGLIVRLLGIDPISGNDAELNTDITAITATGLYLFELYPGSSSAGASGASKVNQRISASLPRTWYAKIVAGDSSSYTYSLGYSSIL